VSASALRPRSVTELIDAAFQLLRRHYLQFVSISAVFLIPVIIIQTLFMRAPAQGQIPNPGWFLAFLPVVMLALLGSSAVVVGVSDSYVRDRVDVGHAIRRAMSRFFPIIGGTIGMYFAFLVIAMGIGIVAAILVGGLAVLKLGASVGVLMALIVFPAMLFAMLATFARIFAVPLVIVLENTSISGAFARSIALTKGSVARVIGVFVLTFVILFALLGLMLAVTAYLSTQAPRGQAIYSVMAGTLNIFIYPVFTVFITLLYYDLRIRRDGFDLEVMEKELLGPN
jgi:hypothetical protein